MSEQSIEESRYPEERCEFHVRTPESVLSTWHQLSNTAATLTIAASFDWDIAVATQDIADKLT